MNSENKNHWEKVYKTKNPSEVSWTQDIPETSLRFIRSFNISKNSPIIDIGGGDSKLVDFLLEEGFKDITVLDISKHALDRAKLRLGNKADKVKWIETDIIEFRPERKYQVWHDRATFHFLTSSEQINKYLDIVSNAVSKYIAIGTFSDTGPNMCSGLEIKKYSPKQLSDCFENRFNKIKCITEDHITPFNTIQNFSFCSFLMKND